MSSLFNELKRRNVVRVGVAYLVIGWVLAQVVDVIAEPLSLPDWFPTAVIVLLGVGFPIALILAWAFELTPEGLKRSDEVDPTQSITPRTGRKLNYVTAGALVVALGYIAWDATHEAAAALDPSVERSIAVLPFTDMSPAGDQAWFGDGVADAILHDLAQSDDLKVISRSSSFTFRDTVDIPTVAQALGARFVLEGSVMRAEDRVRVIAQLIDSQTDSHVWSETFNLDLDDIFAVQDEIAGEIAEALSVSLGAGERGGQPPPSLDTYDLILQARAAQTDRTGEGILRSVALLEEAVRSAPNSADALGELAMARLLPVYWARDTLPQQDYDAFHAGADSAASAALAINPTDVEALLAAGSILTLDYEFERAEELYLRALEVSPGSAVVFNWYGDLLQFWDRLEEAMTVETRAAELDPLQPANHMNLGNVYEEIGDDAAAAEAYRRSLELSPTLLFPRAGLMVSLYRQGALDEMVEVARGDPDPGLWPSHLRGARILRGLAGEDNSDARADLVAWAGEVDSSDPVRTHWVGRLLLLAGERDLWASLDSQWNGQPEPWGGWQIDTHPDTLAAHPGYAAYMRSPPRDKLIKARGHWEEE
ncbi:MAG: tetratricopeptide repeat protein [Gemmatimonadota bacterium]